MPFSPSSDDALAWTPAWRLRELFFSRKLSPLEFAEFLLARIERSTDLGAFISLFPEHLLEQANIATEQIARRKQDLPLLHGLPVSCKDSIFTKGQRTTLGSLLFKHHEPDIDSVASERLKQFGAIIFGKTNMPEFELNRRSLNLLTREAVNPWDQTKTSGGSSGGAAVAAAAGLGPLAVGVDGGGSIRIPSAFACGSGGITPFQYTAYTHIVNVSGYCAASIPIGFHLGLPVGLQLIGRPGEEHLLLRAARAFERERPWAAQRPPVN